MSEVEQQMFDERMAAADAGLTNVQTAEDRFPAEDVIRAEQEKALDLIRANEMARNERLQMTGFEETAARNAEAAKAERDAEQAAEEAPDQPTPPPASADQPAPTTKPKPRPDLLPEIDKVAGTDAPPSDKSNDAANILLGGYGLAEPGEKLSPKETVSRYEKLFKEMLGESDEDKAKEMWHNMAMIGFAIASGESPRALQNISNGLLAGTKMMKEDRASERKRKDTITMMAIEAAQEDLRADKKYARDIVLAGIKKASDRSEYLYNTVYGETFKSHLEDNPGDYTGASAAAAAAAKAAAPNAPSAGGGSTGQNKYIIGQKYKIEGKDYTYKGGNSDDPSSWALAE